MTAPTLADPYVADQRAMTQGEAAAVVALALFFASTAAVHATLLPALLVRRLMGLGLTARAVQTAGRMTLEPALTGRNRHGSPVSRFGPQTMVRRMAAEEPTMRARYLLAAAKRLTKASAQGLFTSGLKRERVYLDAHRRAGQRRAAAARAYDKVVKGHEFLRWSARMDSRTTADCAALNGRIWHVEKPPFPPPGAVHIHCRCVAVAVVTPNSAAQAAA